MSELIEAAGGAGVKDQYSMMYLIRAFEAAALKLWRSGEIRGAMHLSDGQEAVAVGTCTAAAGEDYLCCTYRSHAWALAWGLTPVELFGELLGRSTGCVGGRGGSKHLGDLQRNMLPGNAIVGGQLAIGAGIAFSGKYFAVAGRAKHVAIVVLGDGALAQGTFHETVSMASIWRLPVVFICENNLYSELTLTADVAPAQLGPRVESYGMAYRTCDGMDVVDVERVVSDALAHARQLHGPVFVEAFTYRFCGHHTGDAEKYRTAAEVDAWRERDPLGARMIEQAGLQDIAEQRRVGAIELIGAAVADAVAAPMAQNLLAYR